MRKNQVKFQKGQEIGVENAKSTKKDDKGSIGSRRGVKSPTRLESVPVPEPSAR